MSMDFSVIKYKEYGKCLKLTNHIVDLLIPLEFGLRILHYAPVGEENLFYEQQPEHTSLTTEKGWRIYGGHRLWAAPESENVYYPDNSAIQYAENKSSIILRQNPDPWLNIQKEIDITLSENSTQVKLDHRITYLGKSQKKLALWAITAMRERGFQTIPYFAPDTYMAPNRFISFWSYTDPSDGRFKITNQSIQLAHMPVDQKFKIGINNYSGTASYNLGNLCFVKRYTHNADAHYPDNNTSYQTFLCKHMTEMETLSPLHTLKEGQTAGHTEYWEIT